MEVCSIAVQNIEDKYEDKIVNLGNFFELLMERFEK